MMSGLSPDGKKKTTIRRIAVRQTSVSLHQGRQIEGPLKLPIHQSTIVLRYLGGLLIDAPLCRETPVCRTANVCFFQSGSVMHQPRHP